MTFRHREQLIDQPATRWDTAVELLMAALLLFAPLAYGTTEPWSQLVATAIVALMATLVAIRLIVRPDIAPRRTWAFAPIALFVGLIVLQLLPLPTGLLQAIAPSAVRVQQELIADPAAASIAAPTTISFYRWATLRELRLILIPIALFWVVLNVYRTPAQIRRLLVVMALSGLLVAMVALHQNLSGSRLVYGIVEAVHPNSGPFMNHSHFGQFMNLSIGAALGLLLVLVSSDSTRYGQHSSFARWLPWGLGVVIILGGAMIAFSLTRGGTLSLLIAGGVIGAALTLNRRGKGRGTLIAGLGILLLSVLLYAGFDRVYERMATVRAVQSDNGGRWEILEDLSALWRQHPIVGTGLGTHEVVFPAYNRAPAEMIATHAENEYAQLMEETGAVGLFLALWFLAIVVAACWRLLRRPSESIHFAAFGLAYGLLCILIHSASDFGQHMPAIAAFTAITCALILQLDRSRATVAAGDTSSVGESKTDKHRKPAWSLRQGAWRRHAVAALTLFVILASATWSLAGLNNQRLAAADWREADAIDTSLTIRGWDEATNEELAELLSRTEAAVQHDPLNIKYRYALNQFRWQAVSRVRDPDTNEVLLTSDGVEHVKAIIADLQANKPLCPTFGLTHSLAGQLQWFVLASEAGKVDIRTGYRLAPYHRSVTLTAGLLEAQEGQWEAAARVLARAIALDGSSAPLVLDTCIKSGRIDVARSLAKGNRAMLQQLASRLQEMPDQQEVAAACLREAEALTRIAAEQAGASPASVVELAELHVRDGNKAEAIKCYRNALAGDYAQVPWRLRLARLLADAGQADEAVREARLCLRLRPQFPEAQGLIAELASHGFPQAAKE